VGDRGGFEARGKKRAAFSGRPFDEFGILLAGFDGDVWVLVNLALVENFLKCALNILKK
jgi:hypothetical protein